jgi:hypothetical protein
MDMVDGAGEVGTAVGAGGMVSSAVSAGEMDMVDGAGEVGTAVFFGKHIYRLNTPLAAVDPVDP